jgi:hypothetical protein
MEKVHHHESITTFCEEGERMGRDDQKRKGDDLDQTLTLKFEALQGADRIREMPLVEEQTVEARLLDPEEMQALIEASRRGELPRGEKDAPTAMLSREELFRNAQVDRSQHRVSKPTRRLDAQRQEREDTTVAFALDPVMLGGKESIGSVDRERGMVEYPVRFQTDYQVGVPADLAEELGLKPGELVIVTIRKIQG